MSHKEQQEYPAVHSNAIPTVRQTQEQHKIPSDPPLPMAFKLVYINFIINIYTNFVSETSKLCFTQILYSSKNGSNGRVP